MIFPEELPASTCWPELAEGKAELPCGTVRGLSPHRENGCSVGMSPVLTHLSERLLFHFTQLLEVSKPN